MTAVMLLGISTARSEPTYRMADLLPNIERMLRSKAIDAFFVVEVAESPDFIQIYGSDGKAYLNFPMFTPRQESHRADAVRMCAELSLTVTVNQLPNGAENLDCALPQSAKDIAAIVRKFLERLYSADEGTPLELEANGFELTAAI